MPLLQVVEETLKKFDGDEADRASLVARLRLLRKFEDQTHRVDWLIARLLAMSTLRKHFYLIFLLLLSANIGT